MATTGTSRAPAWAAQEPPAFEALLDEPFLMPVEDVFDITGRGTVVTGQVERGRLNVNEEVEIVGIRGEVVKATVTSMETFHEAVDSAQAGDNVGLVVSGVDRDVVLRGMVLAVPGSVGAHSKVEAEVYFLREGSWADPISSGEDELTYRFRTADVGGAVTFPEGAPGAVPGDTRAVRIALDQPVVLEEGLVFAVLREGTVVGQARVTAIVE